MKKIFVILIITTFILLGIFTRKYFIYSYEKYVLFNASTILMPCSAFSSLAQLESLKSNSIDLEHTELEEYLESIGGLLYITTQPGCPEQYRFEVAVNSDENTKKVLEILKDQKLFGYGVYVRNV